ncbi:MAG: hypothetical protein HY908_22565 [Myxococcales bacterium]|nr:hypothetical protein [Myxococcales bacterium]
MQILSLRASGVLGLPDGAYDFGVGDEPHVLVAITGAGPCGKTSLLEAVAAAKELVGPYGRLPAPASLVRRGARRATLAARWLLDDAEQAACVGLEAGPAHTERRVREIEAAARGDKAASAPSPPQRVVETNLVLDLDADALELPHHLAPVFGHYDRAPGRGKAEYFPADRRIRAQLWTEPAGPSRARDEAAPRLGRALGKYGFVRPFLRALAAVSAARREAELAACGVLTRDDANDELTPFREALAALARDLRLARVELANADGAAVWFVRRDRREVELDALSDSEADAVLFAATFVRQGLAARSLVLVDRPELHQDPTRAAAFVQALACLGENQLVVATSAAVASALEGARVLRLEARHG